MQHVKIFCASDHGGFEAKSFVLEYLQSKNYECIDLGVNDSCNSVDYPDYAQILAQNLKNTPDAIGILICGSGIGISIAANRYSFIRCALCYDEQMAYLARSHNNANVLAFGGRFCTNDKIKAMLDVFLTTSFEGGRHKIRIEKLEKLGK